MNKNHSLKLGFIFSLVIFLLMFAAHVILFAITAIYYHFGIFQTRHLSMTVFQLYAVSMIIGTIISVFLGKKILAPLVKFSEALKEVGKGNFNIKLDSEKYYLQEFKSMSRNFNIMVNELNNIETFRSDFIANVSHEFKTPLASIEGYALLLQESKLTDKEKTDYINKILSNTNRLSSLVCIILQISRLENQEFLIEKNKFKLDEQLRQVLLLLEPKWNIKNIELNIDFDEISFYGNEELLMQVWENIFNNAIKFTPANGTITCTLSQSSSCITTTITDNGIGMSADVLKHIFDKFYQGDRSHSYEGNGLGLALVKRIIDLCDGTIEVYSTYGKGSTFIVKLPCE